MSENGGLLSESDCREILQRIIGFSKADSIAARVEGGEESDVRFALNNVTTTGCRRELSVSVDSNFGRRSASASTDQADPASLEALVRKSEELAQLAPEDPEFIPRLGAQKYVSSPSFDGKTALAGPGEYAGLCAPAIHEAEKGKVSAAGYVEGGARFSALATSTGLFAWQKLTSIDYSVTARMPRGNGVGSGWAGSHGSKLGSLDAAALAHQAIRKCHDSNDPITLDPGKYTVILDRSAVSDLMRHLIENYDTRSADEGRSFLTKKGGGNRLGEKVFGENITLFSDPADEQVPDCVFAGDGSPNVRRTWVEKGVVKEMICSRYWARKQGVEAVPDPSNLILPGGDGSVDELIAQADRAILVTRFWYIRVLDPQTVLLTGLTRDGTFLVEKGKITKPVHNFRFNESPVAVLNNVLAMGRSEAARGGEGPWSICVPPMLVKNFTFSSVSQAA